MGYAVAMVTFLRYQNDHHALTSDWLFYYFFFRFCFFFVGCRHGSFQRPGTLVASDDHIDRPLFYGAYFSIQVPPADLQDAQCR